MGRMMRSILLFMVFWSILAEKINFERTIIGICICMCVYCFNKNENISKQGKSFHDPVKIVYLIIYLGILIKEIVVANFQVAKIVLSPNMKIYPQVIKFHSKLKTNFYRTILANSITLTPGTLTVFMEENQLVVHCLKKEYIEDVLNSKFEKILLKIEE